MLATKSMINTLRKEFSTFSGYGPNFDCIDDSYTPSEEELELWKVKYIYLCGILAIAKKYKNNEDIMASLDLKLCKSMTAIWEFHDDEE